MRVDAYITRAGVFEYLNPDGSTRFEYRPISEVHNPASLASFEGVPVTNDHPAARVDTKNAREVARGTVGEGVRPDGEKVAAALTIFDAELIARMDSGDAVEVSCGYECDEDHTPGVFNGQRYDLIQRNIRGNHVAIVAAGRAGPEVRVRMDAAEQTAAPRGTNREDGKITMDFEKLYKDAVQATATEKARADAAEGALAAEKKRADSAEGALASEKARADAAEKARTDAAAGLPARVAARVALEGVASKVLKTDEIAGKSDRDIMVAFVEKVDGEKIATEKSLDYVEAYFASASKRADAAAASLASARGAIFHNRETEQRTDAAGDPEAAAHAAMVERDRNAWRAPLAATAPKEGN